jgi:D-sedoheptulose 7-phosphate isomerase
LEAKGAAGDVLIGLSTSGNSKNVIRAMEKANALGIITIGLTGGDRSAKIGDVAKFCIFAPSTITPRIQEAHILIGHMLCEYVEEKLFPATQTGK